MSDPNAATRAYLADYLARPKPGYAVLIAAPWGAGKTRLIKDLIAEQKEKPLFVSLFGVANEEGIQTAISREILGGEAAAKSVKTWNQISAVIKKATGADLHMSLSDAARFLPLPVTLVFDDIERAGLPIKDILGFLNRFVERDGCRVILLANEAKLGKDWGEGKEKVIGQTLPVVADIDAALPLFLDELPKPTRSFVKAEDRIVAEVFRKGGHHNLRSLQQVLRDFHRVYLVIDEDLRACTAGMRKLLALFLALSQEVKAGVLTREDLVLRDGIDIGKKPKFEALRQAAAKYDRADVKEGRYGAVLNGELSARILCDGAIDASAIRECLIASGQFIVPEEPEWQSVWWALARDPERVQSAFAEMERKFFSRAYTEPGVILHVFHLRLQAKEIGLLDQTLPEIETACEDYIGELAAFGRLAGLNPSRSAKFDESGFGGLGYPKRREDDPHPDRTEAFWRLHDLLQAAQRKVFEAGLPEQADALVRTLSGGEHEAFIASLWRSGKEETGRFRSVPVLAHADEKALAGALASYDGEVLRELGRTLSERYRGYRRELSAEIDWLPQLVQALEAEVKNRENPVHAWQIDRFIQWTLKKAIIDNTEIDEA